MSSKKIAVWDPEDRVYTLTPPHNMYPGKGIRGVTVVYAASQKEAIAWGYELQPQRDLNDNADDVSAMMQDMWNNMPELQKLHTGPYVIPLKREAAIAMIAYLARHIVELRKRIEELEKRQ